jgi:hypothetical protein
VELKDYYFFTKKNNFEKKSKIQSIKNIGEWEIAQPQNNNLTMEQEVPLAPVVSAPEIKQTSDPVQQEEKEGSLPPSSSEIFHLVSEYHYHYDDIDDSELRKQDKMSHYQAKSYIGRWAQVALELEPNQKMTPALFANPTFVKIICQFLEALYNSPKTAANHIKMAKQMWSYLKTTPTFHPFDQQISHFQLLMKARISKLQGIGQARLQQITEEGKIVAGKMLSKEQWEYVGNIIGNVLTTLQSIPVENLTRSNLIKYKYFLWTGLQYLSGGHRPQILVAKKDAVRLVGSKVYLSVLTSKTGAHTPEIIIQDPMDFFLWHWVSAILNYHYPNNPSLWPQETSPNGKKEQNIKEMDTNLIKDMFRVVLKSIFPWKTITNYAVRTYQGSHSENTEWAASVFTSIPIQEIHYDITNKVEQFYKVVEEVNEQSGFLGAINKGIQDAKEKTPSNNNNNNNDINNNNTTTQKKSRLENYINSNIPIETIKEIHQYRYEKSGIISFLCTVEIRQKNSNQMSIAKKIIIDRDLIHHQDLVTEFWKKITPSITLPWEETQPKTEKKRKASKEKSQGQKQKKQNNNLTFEHDGKKEEEK